MSGGKETDIPLLPAFPPGLLWSIEVGTRAALRTETRQRDIKRWFRGLFAR